MPSHLHTQLPLATRTRRDEVASMLAIENDLAETIIVTLEHAERTLGRDHNPQVSQALRHANKLLEAHGIEPIIDRDYWVNPYFGDAIALYINLGDNTLPTILFDTTDDEFYLAAPDHWVQTYEEARFHDELTYTTVHLESTDDSQVIATIRHPRASDLAAEHKTIAGHPWQTDDTLVYAILENHEDLVDELEAEDYYLKLDEYTGPSSIGH